MALFDANMLRQQSRIDADSDDDQLLDFYIASATARVQKFLAKSILPQQRALTWTTTRPADVMNQPYQAGIAGFDASAMGFGFIGFGGFYNYANKEYSDIVQDSKMNIFYGPVQSIQNVTATFWSGNTVELVANVDYQADINNEPGRLRLHHCYAAHPHVANHQIIYTAAIAPNTATVPTDIVHAVLLTATRMYEKRGDAESGDMLTTTAKSMIYPYKMPIIA
jgi:hypothetical protein